MYSKQFWDDLYRDHLKDVPWMCDTHTQRHLSILERYLCSVKGKRLLDYGCGNGKIAFHFYEEGAIVTLADISDTLVEWLSKEYAAVDIEILQAATPFDIPVSIHKFDIIIAGAVFHHIQPDLWNSFILGFSEHITRSGTIVISGWDETDVLFSKTNKAPYTHEPVWPINGLRKVIIDSGLFKIVDEIVYPYMLPEFFQEPRVFRYYVLKQKKKYNNK